MNPKFYMLCGVPGSGKSTLIQNFPHDYFVISTDKIIEMVANQHGLTYNDVFGNITYSFAEKMIHKIAQIHFQREKNVIWDQTNLTVRTRARKLTMVPEKYEKIAIALEIPKDLQKRLDGRPDKKIPPGVLTSMIKGYTIPTLNEGFDQVIII